MPPKLKTSIFPGLLGHPSIVQDDLAFLRALYIGSLVADRDFYRAGRPGMGVGDSHMINNVVERAEYVEICKTLEKSSRYPRTQNQNTRNFFFQLGYDFTHRNFDPSSLTVDNIAEIHEKLAHRYRLILVRYHNASRLCTIEWKSETVMPRNIFIVTDGMKYDALGCTFGIFNRFLCSGCLKCSESSGLHRCGAVYRVSNGEHVCGRSVWCALCKDYTNDEHLCKWKKMESKTRENLQRKQKKFRFCFFDIECCQAEDFGEGETPQYYSDHYATTISLCKVCWQCENLSPNTICPGDCGIRKKTFQYSSKTEDPYKVVDDFCHYIMHDRSMRRRMCISHNGARYDSHLIIRGFLRLNIKPQIINKGTSIIRAEAKLRGASVILRDSYCSIPIPLSEFPKAFDLDCEEKGMFPHMLNTRANWGKVWDSIPPVRYFGRQYMKPEQQKKFDSWYATMEGKQYNQDEILKSYCELDVEICMKGCLKFRKLMIEHTSWCPFFNSNTIASFSLYQLKNDFLNDIDIYYLPENGFGAIKQSALAIRYFRYLSRDNRRQLQFAHSPYGEKKVKIGNHTFSLDCYEASTDTCWEIAGCFWHD